MNCGFFAYDNHLNKLFDEGGIRIYVSLRKSKLTVFFKYIFVNVRGMLNFWKNDVGKITIHTEFPW